MTTDEPRARVLVVEDDHDAATVLADCLEQAGYVAEVVHDADEALASARRHPPAAVIADLRLRGGPGGLELLGELAGAVDPVPALIAVSGYASDDERRRARALGIGEVIAKPFDPATLVERVRTRIEVPREG